MNKVIPVLSFVLALISFCLKYIQLTSQTTIARLYTIDAVSAELKSEIVKFVDYYTFFALTIGSISIVMVVVSMNKKFCNKIIGSILLFVSALSVVFSLINH